MKIFSKVTPPPAHAFNPSPPNDMFFPVTFYKPHNFTPPAVCSLAAEAPKNFFFASFVKGDKKREKVFSALQRHGIFARLVPDPERSWTNYEIFQVYTPGGTLSRAYLEELLSHEGNGLSPPVCGKEGFYGGLFACQGLRDKGLNNTKGET